MDNNLTEALDNRKLLFSLQTANDLITKDYLYKLENFEVKKLDEELAKVNISEYTRVYKFTKIVSDKDESVLDKLVTVLNAAYSSNATVFTIVKGTGVKTEYYLGVVSKDIKQAQDSIDIQGNTLEQSLKGNFPGLEIDHIQGKQKDDLLSNALKYNTITAVSGIASIRNEKTIAIKNTYKALNI